MSYPQCAQDAELRQRRIARRLRRIANTVRANAPPQNALLAVKPARMGMHGTSAFLSPKSGPMFAEYL